MKKYCTCLVLLVVLTASSSAQGSLSSDGGRYVFGQISGLARAQYMLDTETGRLWQMVTHGEGERLVLQAIPYATPTSAENLAPGNVAEEQAAHDEYVALIRAEAEQEFLYATVTSIQSGNQVKIRLDSGVSKTLLVRISDRSLLIGLEAGDQIKYKLQGGFLSEIQIVD